MWTLNKYLEMHNNRSVCFTVVQSSASFCLHGTETVTFVSQGPSYRLGPSLFFCSCGNEHGTFELLWYVLGQSNLRTQFKQVYRRIFSQFTHCRSHHRHRVENAVCQNSTAPPKRQLTKPAVAEEASLSHVGTDSESRARAASSFYLQEV